MKILRMLLAVLLCAPACISRADAVEDAYANTAEAGNQPRGIQAVPNLGISAAHVEKDRSEAWWDIGLGSAAAVLGVLGLGNAKTAEKAWKDADSKMVTAMDDANYHANWAGWWEGWGDSMQILYGSFDSLTLNARSYQSANLTGYDSAINTANEQKKIVEVKKHETGLWTGVGYLGLATGGIFIIKGMLTLSRISSENGRIAGINVRLEAQSYPDTRLALAYDF